MQTGCAVRAQEHVFGNMTSFLFPFNIPKTISKRAVVLLKKIKSDLAWAVCLYENSVKKIDFPLQSSCKVGCIYTTNDIQTNSVNEMLCVVIDAVIILKNNAIIHHSHTYLRIMGVNLRHPEFSCFLPLLHGCYE